MKKINTILWITIYIKFLISSLPAQVVTSEESDLDQLEDRIIDSTYIAEYETFQGKPKVLHAEPLFIDLIRDLGARKGEAEWNVGLGLFNKKNYDEILFFVEYEWAVIDRLGLEIEIPVNFFSPHLGANPNERPQNQIESIKLAAQWTFYVNTHTATSLALGYLNETFFSPLNTLKRRVFAENKYNPFLIAAKRWGNNWHSLVYAGPQIFHSFNGLPSHSQIEWNSNVHYMLPGTRNFIGLEVNKYLTRNDFFAVFRPQMRLQIKDNFLIGIVTGIPISYTYQNLSTFFRIIWEPSHI
ncbi:HAEPLYID family protein [Thermaurantimonas aggregans]|nr:HAEPLYID family protein [Thermaurantimonas aggregans]